MRHLLLILLLSFSFAASAQTKTMSKEQAGSMIAKHSWQYGTIYTVILNPQISTLPALMNDKSYFRKVLERNDWEFTDFGSGNYDPVGARISVLTFRHGAVQCKVSRKYTYTTKMKDGNYNMRLSEELEFSKVP